MEFDDGAPSEATAALFAGHLDFLHGIEAFLGVLPGASLAAIRRGFLFVGAEDNSFLLFSELMDSASVFLTGNCDTVYFWGFLDLSDGPMVITCRRSMRPQASSTQSTTCGSGGSPTSVFPARIAARAAGISWWVRATKGRPTSREPFWPVLMYDNQTLSMLQTDRHLPRLGSQSGTIEANPDGSIDIYFGPTAPEGKQSNWLQTVPGK